MPHNIDFKRDQRLGTKLCGSGNPNLSPSNEADHRIANSLQFLAAMLRHESGTVVSAASAKATLLIAANRLSAMARVHHQLTQHPSHERGELADFLRPFCTDVSDSIGATVRVTAPGVVVRAETASQIGIILNEFATNAVKHARRDGEQSVVTIEARRMTTGQLNIVIGDNGPGLPDGFSPEASTGLGMMIMVSAVEKMDGTIRMIPGNGTRFEIITALL